ncbi:hypothetical protein [Pseudobythopirellula maris]|nr:hypothetical protein [Pseudobythopirellula maris]
MLRYLCIVLCVACNSVGAAEIEAGSNRSSGVHAAGQLDMASVSPLAAYNSVQSHFKRIPVDGLSGAGLGTLEHSYHEQLSRIVNRFADSDPSILSADDAMGIALSYEMLGDWKLAQPFAERASLAGDDERYSFSLLRVLLNTGQLVEVEERLGRMSESGALGSDGAIFYLFLARKHASLGDMGNAVRHANAYVDCMTKKPNASAIEALIHAIPSLADLQLTEGDAQPREGVLDRLYQYADSSKMRSVQEWEREDAGGYDLAVVAPRIDLLRVLASYEVPQLPVEMCIQAEERLLLSASNVYLTVPTSPQKIARMKSIFDYLSERRPNTLAKDVTLQQLRVLSEDIQLIVKWTEDAVGSSSNSDPASDPLLGASTAAPSVRDYMRFSDHGPLYCRQVIMNLRSLEESHTRLVNQLSVSDTE